MTIKCEASPNAVTLRVPAGTTRVLVLYEGARPAINTESVEVMRIPYFQCRAIRAVGERCRRTTWTATINETQLCNCHLAWPAEGRSMMQVAAGWPEAGRMQGLEVPALMPAALPGPRTPPSLVR